MTLATLPIARARHVLVSVGRTAVGLLLAGGLLWLAPRLTLWTATAALVALVVVVRTAARRTRRLGLIPVDADALTVVRHEARRAGGGAFIGLDSTRGGIVHAPAESACLVLGPPRRGKTSSVVVPSVLCAPGAALVTSTKPDVLMATARARSRFGTIYIFDPSGQAAAGLPEGVVRLRWSPLDAAGTWESARRLSAAMVAASPAAKGSRNESHWTSRAAALLGPLLYAAALSGRDMLDVVTWVLSGSIKEADQVLTRGAMRLNQDAAIASQVLAGVQRAADQERQSIWSATADVIDVYTTTEALEAATGSNFNPADFVRGTDTIYIASAAEHQAASAPLVVALIDAIRDAQYRRHRAETTGSGRHGAPVSLILDEVANVAPIASLPALVSEAGGQGLHVLAAIQDLSQIRGRWGVEIADGFLSLFQHVLVLGGIRDTRTLEALSTICGEWDRPQVSLSRSVSRTRHPGRLRRERTTSYSSTSSTVRQRRLTPGEIYELADGQALYLSGAAWGWIQLAPHYAHRRWQAALAAAPDAIVIWEDPAPARRLHPAFADPPPPTPIHNGHKTGGAA